MIYAEVILPVPVQATFTYLIPQAMQSVLQPGMRVVVPFGKAKQYVGVVSSLHNEKPKGYNVKEIAMALDVQPVVTDVQLRLWHWIADYYMAPIGDVFKAALPSAMKTAGGYKPKTDTYITIAPKFAADQGLGIALDMVKAARQQLKALNCFLSMSGWKEGRAQEEVSREALLNECHCSAAIVRNLIDRGILVTYEKETGRLNKGYDAYKNLSSLNEYQQQAFDSIKQQWQTKNTVLLHGVTSSGKTEIYLHLIQEAIDKGQQVLYLLPEIALTVQMTERLKAVLGKRIGIYHSRYSDQERAEIWLKQLSEEPYDVILGARSAVFLPMPRLGLIIIDEEHETSFKQQEPTPRYHARSTAIMLAAMTGAKTLLGTATPSIETYHNALTGKFGLVKLTHRFQDLQLPDIEIIDVKDLRRRKIMTGILAPALVKEIREAIDNGQQAILFQNRRGFAPVIECKECGWTPHCNRCDVPLTYHRQAGMLSCHYCGNMYPLPENCPNCGSHRLHDKGTGTEKIEEKVAQLLPDAKIARMDFDTTRTQNAYERIISDFSQGKTNVLIGTQMISKGLDFDHVRVVGIIDADTMINMPDFRAYEHAFTMLTQVSGRAGRKGSQGKVMLQTRNKDLPLIAQIKNNDYEAYYKQQEQERRDFQYPPFCNLIYIYLRHSNEGTVDRAALMMGQMLMQVLGQRVLGPDKPAVGKVKNQFIRKIVIKAEPTLNRKWLRQQLYNAGKNIGAMRNFTTVQVFFDVDPY